MQQEPFESGEVHLMICTADLRRRREGCGFQLPMPLFVDFCNCFCTMELSSWSPRPPWLAAKHPPGHSLIPPASVGRERKWEGHEGESLWVKIKAGRLLTSRGWSRLNVGKFKLISFVKVMPCPPLALAFLSHFFVLSSFLCPVCYALSWICFPRGTTAVAEGLSCCLWWVCPDQLCPPQRSPWPHPSEATPAAPLPDNTWAPVPSTRTLSISLPDAGSFCCKLSPIWIWAGFFFWSKESYTSYFSLSEND